jgi:hypothetical protein
MSSSSSCGEADGTFDDVSSEILNGIDPETDTVIWACVQEGSKAAGRNNPGIKLVLTEGDPSVSTSRWATLKGLGQPGRVFVQPGWDQRGHGDH